MQVDADRLWQTIQDMGEIGKTLGGGSSRLALSDEDIEGRKEFLRYFKGLYVPERYQS